MTKNERVPHSCRVLCDRVGLLTFPYDPYSPVRNLYCPSFSGTTLSRPCRTSGDSEKTSLAFTSASVTGFAIAFPTLILTCGFRASEASTEITLAVPTALFSSPV